MTQKIWEQGYTQNRELSWLQFNARVLAEAEDENVPLLERFKFLAIFTSNLDEFFMIRVGSLCDMAAVDKEHTDSKSGLTAKEQLHLIYKAVEPLYARRDAAFSDVDSKLSAIGLRRLTMDSLAPDEQIYIKRYFKDIIAPVLSPQIVESHHPFPHLEGKVLHIAALLSHKKTERLGLLPVPASLPPVVFLPETPSRYILTEDILLSYADHVFEMYDVLEKTVLCVTRNADIQVDDETFGVEGGDFRKKMEKLLRQRRRMAVVRVEINRPISDHFKEHFRSRFEVSDAQIFLSRTAPLKLGYAFSLGEHLPEKKRAFLSDAPFTPQQPAMLSAGQSLLKAALLAPSSMGKKPVECIVVRNKETIARLKTYKKHGTTPLGTAPLAIVVIADGQKSDVWVEDASIVSILIQLEAEKLGLGSTWIQLRRREGDSGPSEEAFRQELGIPEHYGVLSVVAIGHKNEQKKPYTDADLDFTKVHYETF